MTNVQKEETNILFNQINNDIKQAMKSKDTQKRDTLRLIVSQLKNEQIKVGTELKKEDEETIINKYFKDLNEEIEEHLKLGLSVDKQMVEKELILSYLPTQLTEDEIVLIVKDVIVELGAGSKKDMGKVMSTLQGKFSNNADMGFVSKTVLQLLS